MGTAYYLVVILIPQSISHVPRPSISSCFYFRSKDKGRLADRFSSPVLFYSNKATLLPEYKETQHKPAVKLPVDFLDCILELQD
ncbi:uncharacterized protein VTP21DRAFT_6592 [Calcarisporiella thermophila]|uniref:uncharacterized protein n=1 Tax=Calcarisporiella thermophila TaxID=911321 RepID=UPI003742B87F